MFGNQVPIGSIVMFGGTGTTPTNWMICAGQALDTTAYAALFAVIGYNFGGGGASFKLPLFNGRAPVQAYGFSAMGVMGGESTHALTLGETGPHSHNITDPGHAHGASQTAHSHTITTNGHNH